VHNIELFVFVYVCTYTPVLHNIELFVFVLFKEGTEFLYTRGADGIATCYGLDGPGIEFRWGQDFLHSLRPAPGAHPASYTLDTGPFPWVKWPARGADRPPQSSAQVEGRVKLYIYSPSGASWSVLG
jgi:hypothetical protein